MSATLPSSGLRFRSLLARREHLIGAVLLCGSVALICLGDQISPLIQLLFSALLAGVLVVSLGKGWVRLFGPVLHCDLVRTARHSRTFLLRCAYATALLGVLLLLYSDWFTDRYRGVWAVLVDQHHVSRSDMARFAESFFTRFLGVQLAMVFLLTPAYTASAIAEEKERRTLDFLLATDLRSREIVLGKLASRLAHLVLFVLAGLPVLVLLQFLGGVDPNLALAGFAGTALTMLSLASLGILISAYGERSRSAIGITYLLASLFVMCSFPIPGLSAANPIAAWHELMKAAEAGALAAEVPVALRQYALIHGLIAGVCCLWASIQLRWWGQPRSTREEEMIVVRVNSLDGTQLVWRRVAPEIPHRPKVPDRALLWKEKYVEAIWTSRSGLQSLIVFLMILASSVAGLAFLALLAASTGDDSLGDGQRSNSWVRVVGTSFGCLLLLGVALRSAGAFSRERERRTWDSLLTTPLETRELFWAKAWGSVLSVRWGWWFLGAVWSLGMLTRGLSPFVVPLLALAWLVHAWFITSVGVWFSLVSRTTLRATIYTLMVVAGLCFGPLLLASMVENLRSSTLAEASGWFEKLCDYGLSPPPNLWILATNEGSYRQTRNQTEFAQQLVAAYGGVIVLAISAVVLLQMAWLRFARERDQAPAEQRGSALRRT